MIPTRYLWLPLLVITLSGCAGTFDLFSGTHYSESSKERSPTGQVVERTEYRVTQKGALECYAARRAVERERSVSKRYRRRDGLGRNQYTGFAVGDALVGGLVAGVLAGFCTSDQNDLSCWNMLYASPFAIDLVYAIVRRQTTGEAVLVEKNAFGDRLALGRTALFEERTECESVREVRLGKTSGLSDEERLRTGRHKPRVLRGGLGGGGAVGGLQAELLQRGAALLARAGQPITLGGGRRGRSPRYRWRLALQGSASK